MRKVTLEIVPNPRIMEVLGPFMEHIEEMEMIELLRLDMRNGVKVGVVRVRLAPGSTVDDISSTGLFDIKVMEVMEQRGDEAVCLIKAETSTGFQEMREKADLDLTWAPPMKLSRDKVVYSFIGEDDQIRKLVELTREFGETVRTSIHNAAFTADERLSSLTERQREIMVTAKKLGYYRYPREADAREVAKALGISTSTVVEHLRKAEIRLIGDILSGY